VLALRADHRGNLYAFLTGNGLNNGYGGTVGTPGAGMLDGHEDVFVGNTVVQQNDGAYALPICSGRGATVLANNTVFTPRGNVTECGVPLAQWQADGNDPGTVALPYPASNFSQTLIALATAILNGAAEEVARARVQWLAGRA
jgi:hypothetical protein